MKDSGQTATAEEVSVFTGQTTLSTEGEAANRIFLRGPITVVVVCVAVAWSWSAEEVCVRLWPKLWFRA